MKPYSFIIFSWLCLAACGGSFSSDPQPEPPDAGNSVEKAVTIDAGQTFQTIAGFGASDCWSPAFVGKHWTRQRNAIARLLFSSEITDGQPQGIGLSQWRVNLGGGSFEQGEASGIENKSRRAESYLTDNLTLDLTRCEGQRFFMKSAHEMGCRNFVLFSNTPPVQYTYNGKGFSAQGASSNLKPEHYDDFASYMADVAAHYIGTGYDITHISPVNEPQYNWTGGQEGSGWTNSQIAALARELDMKLTEKGLSTDILLGEAGDWEYLCKVKDDANRSNVIASFFTPDSPTYTGNLKHVKNLICGHSYWTDGTWEGMRAVRRQVAQAAENRGLELWQSEWSMLGDNYSTAEFIGYGQATEMDIALYMAKVIHNDLTVANVSSWCYWTAMDVPRWGHKNRFLLISLLPAGGESGDIEQEGTYRATPTLWVLGNYSRFIRPGYKRIALTLNESRHFFGSAWISPENDEIVAVYTNLSERAVRLSDTRIGWKAQPKSVVTYTTGAAKNLRKSDVKEGTPILLEPQSVTTVIYYL